MKIPHDAAVIVCDGEKLLWLRNDGDSDYPNLEVEGKRKDDNPPDRELTANRRGRVQASAGSARSAYEETDFHQLAEDRFAADAADMLKTRALKNEYAQLIVVAPPRTLGEMRKHYHVEVQKRLIGEVDKELTGHPLDEIEKIIKAS